MVLLRRSDGDKALEAMNAPDNIALVIADVRMEPVGGFEFITWLRCRSSNIATPVILVTGDQTPDILEQAGKLGVIAAVLMKPVDKKRQASWHGFERVIEGSQAWVGAVCTTCAGAGLVA